ncbi:hypothetical protein M0P65_02295 [Candidatus Gracilibacteria bacterium]|nr:hypothetical protein [Candidatus Gracilibacteria bacterium]
MAPTKTETPQVSPEIPQINPLAELKQEVDITKAKEDVKANTGKEVGFLRNKIEKYLTEVNIENVKTSLDTIEKLEDEQDRAFNANYLIGKLEANGYPIYIDSNKIKIDSKAKSSLEFETLINNYSSKNPKLLDSFKTAILQRTTSLDKYITINTDKDGNLKTDKITSETYYKHLTEISGLDKNIFISVEDIKNSNLSQKDKAFMISYKNGAFDDVKIDEKMKQYKEDRTTKLAKTDEIIENMSPAARKNLEDATRIPGDNRSVKQKVGDLLKDPFTEMGKIMTGAGPFGLIAIMGSIIYFLFKEPKLIFGSIAAWGVAKGTGLADHFGNAIEGKAGAREPYRAGIEYSKEMVDWAWTKAKGIPNQISGSIDKLQAKMLEWGNFKDTQFLDAAGNKDEILHSNFMQLYNSKDGFPNQLTGKDGKPVSKEESQELNQKLSELYNKGIDKDGKDFPKKVEKMSVAQVIDLLIDESTSPSAPAKGAAAAGAGAATAGATGSTGGPLSAPAAAPAKSKEELESEKEALKDRISNLKITLFSLADKNNINNFDLNELKTSIRRKLNEFEGQINEKNINESNINLGLFENILTNKISLLSNLGNQSLSYRNNYINETVKYVKGVDLNNYSKKPYSSSWNMNHFKSLLTNFDLKGSDLTDSDMENNVVYIMLEEKIKKLFELTKSEKNIAKTNLYKEYLYADLRLQLHKNYKDSGMVFKKMTEDDIDKLELKSFEQWKTEFSV